jgi:hypothetical protein
MINLGTMRLIWLIRSENPVFSINRQQQGKTSRTGKRDIQFAGFCGRRFVGVGFDPLIFTRFSGNGGDGL